MNNIEKEKLDLKEKDGGKRSKKIIILLLLFLTLLLIVFFISYSIFGYTKKGNTDNTVTTGDIKFLYTENTGVRNGIKITNANPVTDEIGKNYSTENYVFDFKVTAELPNNVTIPYEVTARMSDSSTLPGDIIKIYLVERDGSNEVPSPFTFSNNVVKKFSELNDTTIQVGNFASGNKIIEKTVYNGVASGTYYEKNFRLRMWISDDADFSGNILPDGTVEYKYRNQSFTTTINVYSLND